MTRKQKQRYMYRYNRRYRKEHPEKFDKEYTRDARLRYYYAHRDEMLAQSYLRRQEGQDLIDDIKSHTPCADCGLFYPPYVMDFDHVRGHKQFQIGGNLHLSLERVVQEIEKCDVVCSNCHRMRTFKHKRRGH